MAILLLYLVLPSDSAGLGSRQGACTPFLSSQRSTQLYLWSSETFQSKHQPNCLVTLHFPSSSQLLTLFYMDIMDVSGGELGL